MTSAKATEFLTKQLSIEKETVTFRWLSRKLSVHVNVAKNELASFYASYRSTDAPVHATYLLTGDVAPIKTNGSYRDDDQDEIDKEDDNQELVATSKIVLVGEDDLEAAKAQFTRAPSVHIYSLSPSAIRDAALLAPMADRVRPDDVSNGKAYNQTIGIVVGSDVKIGQTTRPGTSKLATTKPSAGSSLQLNNPAAAKEAGENPKSSDTGMARDKSIQDEKKKGTLDWSKAKVKVDKEQENVATTSKAAKEVVKESRLGLRENGNKTKPEVKKDEGSKVKVKKEPTEANITTKAVELDKPKRGTKRPSAVTSLSDSEDDNPFPKIKARTSLTLLTSRRPSQASGIKVKNGVLLSDDDAERVKEVKPKTAKQKGKGRALVTEEEEEEEVDPSVRAMTDLDDSQVNHHNNRPSASDHQSDEDVEMPSDDDPIPARPKAKRKPKKVIPVGTNGLPKRRVIKSRKSKNAKGYTITEDYSSYESVSESEQVQATTEADKKPKLSRKRAKMEDTDNSSASNAKGNTKSKDKVDEESGKIEGESQTAQGRSETKKPGSGTGGGDSTSRSGAKVSNGGKNNLMSYFTKK